MRNIFVLFLLVFLFAKCDFYRSKFPISEEVHAAISEELLGSWYFLDTIDNCILPRFQIEVLKFENEKYLLTETYFKDKKIESAQHHKIWISKIEDKEYINAYLLDINNPDIFIFHKYRLGKNGQLETTFLRDSFKLEFETQNDFYKYVKNNSEEFDSYFHTPWFPYQRLDSITWGLVNSLWKNEIVQVYRLNQRIEMDNFSEMGKEELKQILHNEKIKKDSILGILENGFLSSFNSEPFWKIKPWFYILEKKDGSWVKMAISKFSFYDITNNHSFRRER